MPKPPWSLDLTFFWTTNSMYSVVTIEKKSLDKITILVKLLQAYKYNLDKVTT